MIKAAFFDVDGTLLSFNTHLVPPSARQALIKLRESGVKIFISTGRSPTDLVYLDKVLGIPFDGFVTTNGQYCYAEDKVIRSQSIVRDDIEAFLPYLDKNKIMCNFVELDYIYSNRKASSEAGDRAILGNSIIEIPVDSTDRIYSHDTYQLCLFVEPENEAEALSIMPNCRAVRWHPSFADIIPKSGGKAVGMKAMLDYFGISLSDSIAFGDGGNDAEMILAAGIGVAMGNAVEELKSVSDYVAPSVDDDGIMNTLRHFKII